MTRNRTLMDHTARPGLLAAFALAIASVGWAYWTTLGDMAQRWAHDPQYSHGYLVPGFALVLLWLRRGMLAEAALQSSWWGAAILGAGVALRLVGAYFHFQWFDALSLLPCLAGVLLMVGGWPAWRWAWPAVLFLVFMVPLPHRLAIAMADPLQRLATATSTYVLQTFGIPALDEGNVILLSEVDMGIVEACSGLRMLVIFFALSTGLAMVVRRRLWERLLIVGSAAPIALVANVARISATGMVHEVLGDTERGRALANAVFHDFAGWLMMPFALALLGIELKLLRHLLIESHIAGPLALRLVAEPAGRVAVSGGWMDMGLLRRGDAERVARPESSKPR